jgi:hypothetical protein
VVQILPVSSDFVFFRLLRGKLLSFLYLGRKAFLALFVLLLQLELLFLNLIYQRVFSLIVRAGGIPKGDVGIHSLVPAAFLNV